jgi:hypothetical protein
VHWKSIGLTILIVAALALAPFTQKTSGDARPAENNHYALTPVTVKWAGEKKKVAFATSTVLRIDTQSGKASILSSEAGGWYWEEIRDK